MCAALEDMFSLSDNLLTQDAMQAPSPGAPASATELRQQGAPPVKRRRLVKAADIASEQVLQQLRKEDPAGLPKTPKEAAIVLDSDDEAAGQHSGSDDDEAAPLRLGMHADLDRGAQRVLGSMGRPCLPVQPATLQATCLHGQASPWTPAPALARMLECRILLLHPGTVGLAGCMKHWVFCSLGAPGWVCAGHKGAVDLAEVGEELQEGALDDVLERCEAISADLRALLGEQRLTDRHATFLPLLPGINRHNSPP